jgi:RecA/RadA recombinase
MTVSAQLQLKKKKKPATPHMLSSGSSLLNLAVSGSVKGAYAVGHYYLIIGDSGSGKTFLTWTTFAEACLDPFFDDHLLVHDDIEAGSMMDVAKYFGKKAKRRVQPPPHGVSAHVMDFYYNLDTLLSGDRPFIYVCDSVDGLGSEDADKKFLTNKNARMKGAKAEGSYGGGQPKAHSENLRRVVRRLQKTKSILLVLNQTRVNLATMSFDKKTTSGGKALTFFAAASIWTSVIKTIAKTVRGRKMPVGIVAQMKTKKNRLQGKSRSVEVPILTEMGIDNVGSIVDWLVEWGFIKKSGAALRFSDLDFKGSREQLIRHLETEPGMLLELEITLQEKWNEIEALLLPGRPSRYE